ncbi:MAG: cysteine rich repeat-containing protein [Acidobacteriia bacterium]|nr:cysteine rich repeat-containing protein [Terriglobia bacterium]
MSRSRTLLILCVIAVFAESLLRPQTLTAQAASPQLSDAHTACASDVQKLCPSVPPGGGRILACLKQHKDEVSDGCKRAILSAMGKSSGDASSADSPAPAASNPAPPAANSAPAAASPAPPAAPLEHHNDAGSASTAASSSPSKSSLPSKQKSHASSTASAVSGEHYFLMKQVKIIDQGLGQGKPAYDLMIPKDWEFKGWVNVGVAEGGCLGQRQ